nr:MAG TPA: Replication associated protein [Microviridae sp.]
MPNSEGKRPVIFNPMKAKNHISIKLPCGQCHGCRLERSRQWAVRCTHEASLHEKNSFITLTFSPDALALRKNEWSLDVRDFQLFMKRLRKNTKQKIRFYHCGEYGKMCSRCSLSLFNCACGSDSLEVLGRPHYHACLFGYDFPDKILWKIVNNQPLYISETLSALWPLGFSTIGAVTFESAAYVARYVMKKINGDLSEQHYVRFDTGEILKPEYTTMSRRDGIGKDWLKTYLDDVYPHDFIVVNGKKCRPPRFYDNHLKTHRPFTFDDVKFSREKKSKLHVDNNTPERLNVRAQIEQQKLNLLPRNKEF